MTKFNSTTKILGGAAMALVFAFTVAASANAQMYSNSYPYGSYSYGYRPTYSGYASASYAYPSGYPNRYYAPLSASCTVSEPSTWTGSAVTWNASVSGGNGAYSYSWYGTDGLYGYSQSSTFTYQNTGVKYGNVTVYSSGQTITVPCANSVTVNNYYPYVSPAYPYNYSTYTYPNTSPTVYPYNYSTYSYTNSSAYNTLDIGCYSDPNTAKVNQPVTWLAEVTGGAAPYTYSWTGTDGLTGSQSSVIKYYTTSGTKSAIVTITSADGKTGSRACSNALTVSGAKTYAYTAPTRNTVTYSYAGPQNSAPQAPATNNAVVAQNQPNAGNSVSNDSATLQSAGVSPFSLNYVPWGWVAIVVILVLFATVLYLMFNREKI